MEAGEYRKEIVENKILFCPYITMQEDNFIPSDSSAVSGKYRFLTQFWLISLDWLGKCNVLGCLSSHICEDVFALSVIMGSQRNLMI